MRHIIDKQTGKYIGFTGKNTELNQNQTEVEEAPESVMNEPFYNFENKTYYDANPLETQLPSEEVLDLIRIAEKLKEKYNI